jgi:hypothetical protein
MRDVTQPGLIRGNTAPPAAACPIAISIGIPR